MKKKNITTKQKKERFIVQSLRGGNARLIREKFSYNLPNYITIRSRERLGTMSGDIVSLAFKKGRNFIDNILYINKEPIACTVASNTKNKSRLFSNTFSLDSYIWINKKLDIGTRVLVSIKKRGTKKIEASLIKVIGDVEDVETDNEFIASNQLSRIKEDKCKKEKFNFIYNDEDIKDLTNLQTITIDPETAKDFDDAISINKDGAIFNLWVHIADVSHYVKENTDIDKIARKKLFSLYLPNKCYHMLPEVLSENLCSLSKGNKKRSVTVYMKIHNNGDLLDFSIYKSIINPDANLSYKEAYNILINDHNNEFYETINNISQVHDILSNNSLKMGAINIDLPEFKMSLENGLIKNMQYQERIPTSKFIESIMIKTNNVVAKYLNENYMIYRVHEQPTDFGGFWSYSKNFGLDLENTLDINEAINILNKIDNGVYPKIKLIKSMPMARYSNENLGHYSLGLDSYCHFTSPIRRYSDLLVHRILFGETKINVEKISNKLSLEERNVSALESRSLFIKKMRYFLSNMKNDTFDCIVTDIFKYGFNFSLLDYPMDGFCSTHYKFSISDNIKVKIKNIDLIKEEIEWEVFNA